METVKLRSIKLSLKNLVLNTINFCDCQKINLHSHLITQANTVVGPDYAYRLLIGGAAHSNFYTFFQSLINQPE